jgi:hypothetical protein
MDKEKTINFAGAIVIFFLLLFVFFKFGPKIPLSIISQQKGEPFVVTGEGKVSVTPDIAVVNLGIEENGASLKQVQDSVNNKSRNLVDIVKRLGIGESDIKTTSYNIYPNYDYNLQPPKITGYRVSTNYQVKVKDFDKVNDILVKATESGANAVGNISFDINETTKNKKLQEAREEAVAKAKEKAQGLAKAAGISLGKITNVSESQGNEIRPMYATKDMTVGGSPTPADIQPGETEISVTVSLSYEVR